MANKVQNRLRLFDFKISLMQYLNQMVTSNTWSNTYSEKNKNGLNRGFILLKVFNC